MEMRVATRIGDVVVEVERKRVRNRNLRMRGDGTFHLSVPTRTGDPSIRRFLDDHAGWIADRAEAWRRRTEAEERFAAPGELALWGRMVTVGDARALLGGEPAAHGEWLSADGVRRLADAVYRVETARVLPGVAARVEARMGISAASWSVRQMKTRWGSCTHAARTIRINAALAAYPPECLECVVAHELAHIAVPNHGPAFHELLDRAFPANRAVMRMLKRPARDVARARTA